MKHRTKISGQAYKTQDCFLCSGTGNGCHSHSPRTIGYSQCGSCGGRGWRDRLTLHITAPASFILTGDRLHGEISVGNTRYAYTSISIDPFTIKTAKQYKDTTIVQTLLDQIAKDYKNIDYPPAINITVIEKEGFEAALEDIFSKIALEDI
jgi:hypothetical protein